MDEGGTVLPAAAQPSSPPGVLADRYNASSNPASVSRSMATLPPLAPRRGDMDGSDGEAGAGAGKVFTVTPEGGMKTATNFSGELFQVVDTKAGASPQGSALTENVAGILYKWVNYGKGWRPRWFALKEGVFSYYKVHGHDKVTVNDNRFKSFRIIGEEAQKLLKKQTHKGSSHPHVHPHVHPHSGGDQSQFRASGEIHLKVWDF